MQHRSIRSRCKNIINMLLKHMQDIDKMIDKNLSDPSRFDLLHLFFSEHLLLLLNQHLEGKKF